MSGGDLKLRTKGYALMVIKLVDTLPHSRAANVIANQLPRAATSVGANYRAAGRAKSGADFIAKMEIVEEEADECLYWLELLCDSDLAPRDQLAEIMAEGNASLAITAAAIKTARSRKP